jgi:glyoxylase-like metal-dependent hydrolase (beta-lactamase superfamily II)
MPTYPTSPLPLSDATCDVIAKAMRAQNISAESLARHAALPLTTVTQALDENASLPPKNDLKTIAKALALHPKALAELANYAPTATPPPELTRIVSPFYHVGSNAYLIRHPNTRTATLFDTGTDASLIHHFLQKENLTLTAIYITHTHHDHISGIDTFIDTPVLFPEDIPHGTTLHLTDTVTLTAVDSSGHYTPSRAYIIRGLSNMLCICGDIIFPGSMGKTPTPEKHRESLHNAQTHIMSLPPHTILCSGHGPFSTISQEAQNNPFLAEQ